MTPTTPREAMLRAAEIAEQFPEKVEVRPFVVRAATPQDVAAAIRAEAEKLSDGTYSNRPAWSARDLATYEARANAAEERAKAAEERADQIRVPLHEVIADLDYCFGRASAEGHDVALMLAASIRAKLSAIDAAIRAEAEKLPAGRAATALKGDTHD